MLLFPLQFSTPRLDVAALSSDTELADTFTSALAQMLTPAVKRHLPPDIQAVNSPQSARNWLEATLSQATFLAVTERECKRNALAGFILLYAQENGQQQLDVRLGYVVAEAFQGQGFASEMLAGLVNWCAESGKVASLSGGAEADNLASIRVLEKSGFAPEGEVVNGTVFLTRHF